MESFWFFSERRWAWKGEEFLMENMTSAPLQKVLVSCSNCVFEWLSLCDTVASGRVKLFQLKDWGSHNKRTVMFTWHVCFIADMNKSGLFPQNPYTYVFLS